MVKCPSRQESIPVKGCIVPDFQLLSRNMYLTELLLSLAMIWASVSQAAHHGGVFKKLRFSRQRQGRVFITLWDLSLHGCLEACRYRPRCASYNYHRLWTRCELHENGTTVTEDLVKKTGFLCSEKAFNNEQEETPPGCNNCQWNETCSSQSKVVCSVQECGPPPETSVLPGLVALGNKWGLLRNIRYMWQSGSPDVVATCRCVITCLATGFWSALDMSCCCPANWESFEGHCYLFSSESLTWLDAQTRCKRAMEGGHLVNVESGPENVFLGDGMKSRSRESMYWIGGNDIQTEGKFVWGHPNGSQLSFTKWGKTEPNNAGRGEDCIVTSTTYQSYRWNDVPCSSSRVFICEFP